MAIYYVDYTNGSDSNLGLSPDSPWKTIAKVNASSYLSGDSILLKRGEVWRETPIWITSNGTTGSPITVGAYGTGNKPQLLGSINLYDPTYWEEESTNIWVADYLGGTGSNLISNSSFVTDLTGWDIYNNSPADTSITRDTSVYDTAPASLRIDCVDNGTSGTDVQLLCQGPFSIVNGSTYILRFRAKASVGFNTLPQLIQNVAPYTNYAPSFAETITIGTDWSTFDLVIPAEATAEDAQLVFFMGGSIPEGESCWVDSASFKLQGFSNLYANTQYKNLEGEYDVGNLILNSEETVGVKKFSLVSLDTQGDFFFDPEANLLKVYSTSNPASYYSNIEAPCHTSGVYVTGNYQTYENLNIKYCGVMGVSGEDGSYNIIIQDVDASYCGGCLLSYSLGGYSNVRYGNGVQLWNNVHDWTVRRCKVDQIFDTGLTNQSGAGYTEAYNLYFYNNIISNCCWGMECSPNLGNTHDVYYEYNTFTNCGYEKTHDQRNNFKYGSGLKNAWTPGTITNVNIRNNIFYNCLDASIDCSYQAFYIGVSNYNLYYSTTGLLADFTDNGDHAGNTFTYSELAELRTTTGQDSNSIVGDPLFSNETTRNYHLNLGSPALNGGQPSSICLTDFVGKLRSTSNPSIGAYEYSEPHTFNGDKIYFDELAEGISEGLQFDDGVGHFDGTNEPLVLCTMEILLQEGFKANELLNLEMFLELTSKENYSNYIDLLQLVPEKFRNSIALQQLLDEFGLQAGSWLGQINDLSGMIDKYSVGEEFLQKLADLVGLTIIMDSTTTLEEKRQQLIQVIDWYKTKGSYLALKYAAYSTGLNVNLWDMYTNDYTTFVQVPWYAGDEGTNPTGLDSSYYKSPHLGIEVPLDRVLGTEPDTYLYRGNFATILSQYVERVRPVNVVPHYTIFLNPVTDATGAATTVSGDIKTALIGGWSFTKLYFDDSNSFDDSTYFDQSDTTALTAITDWQLGTGNKGISPTDSAFTGLESVVLSGSVTRTTVTSTYADYEFSLPSTTLQTGISELGLFLPGGTELKIASTFPDIDLGGDIELRITVRFYYS